MTRALLLVLLLASPALAFERYDHRGSLGLLLAAGPEHRTLSGVDPSLAESGPRLALQLGGTMAIGHDGNELLLLGHAGLGAGPLDLSAAFGYRGYFGDERLRTFIDLGAALHLTPTITGGPRVGLGIQYELAPIAGAWAALGTQLGFGQGLRFSAELVLGIQLRSYLLE